MVSSPQPSPPPIRHLILDRDGVLNREGDDGWVTHPRAWRWEPGALEALRLFREGQIGVSVATNQSCIGRGLATTQDIDAVHRHMCNEARSAGADITAVFYCPHAPGDGCTCRKPEPGLLLQAIDHGGLNARACAFVGDAERDLDAGLAAGLPVILVRTGKGRRTERRRPQNQPIFDNLLAVARCLQQGEDPRIAATPRDTLLQRETTP